jgi:hypothetical protein
MNMSGRFFILFLFSILLISTGVVSADQSAGNAVVELGANDVLPIAVSEVCVFPLCICSDVALAGAQFRLRFDAGRVVPLESALTSRSEEMTMIQAVNGQEMIILIYSAEGKQIAPGDGAVLNITCTVKGAGTGSVPIAVEEVILANEEAKSVPAVVRTTTMSGWIQTPRHNGLTQNYPNPFNPETDIEYQIGDSGFPVHTTLTVYNLLGQEVRTLVDGVRNPGYYTVTWDGKNQFGSQVASGIYFCRFRAGAYATTIKMSLMK